MEPNPLHAPAAAALAGVVNHLDGLYRSQVQRAEVHVEVGLSGRTGGPPRRLPYEMNQDGRERCRNFQSLFAASTPKPCTHFCARDEIENLISSLRLTQVVKSQ